MFTLDDSDASEFDKDELAKTSTDTSRNLILKKKDKQIIKDEEKEIDKVSYSAMIEYFSFCSTLLGGRFSVIIIILLHILINISVSSLSLYLGITLQSSGGGGDGSKGTSFDQSLILIMVSTFAVTVIGKYVSCRIFMSINRNMH